MSTTTISNFIKSYNSLINWVFVMTMIIVVGIITHHHAPNNELVFVAVILPCLTLWTMGIVYIRSPRRQHRPRWIMSYMEHMGITVFTERELKLARQCMAAMGIITSLMVWGCIYFILHQ